jgi:hypothetical protein
MHEAGLILIGYPKLVAKRQVAERYWRYLGREITE